MKNFTFTAIFSGIALLSTAQQITVDFESLTLPAAIDTFYNGADSAGHFTTQGVTFSNQYDVYQGVGYSSGFSYSNMTDVTTGDYTNPYSAITGMGANGSQKYAMFYPEGIITFGGTPVQVDSMKMTNATYGAISMRDGDFIAKQFGSPNNASGDSDGTNGADYLRVLIYGLDQASEPTGDSVIFYLADYRFADNSLDYIVTTWKNVDLQSLGDVYGLSFKFESTDVGQFGINTPTYFGLDNLSYSSTLGVKENSANQFAVYPNPVKDIVNIKGGAGLLTLTDLTGKVIYNGKHDGFTSIDLSNVVSGMYLVSIEMNGTVSRQSIVK